MTGVQTCALPIWKTHQKRAGYLRNEAMANIATHAAIYYDGLSKGSSHMIKIAQEKGLSLRVESKATPALFERYTQPPLDRSTELPPQVIPPPDDKEYETAERTQSVTDDLHIGSLDAVQPKAAPVLEDEALETPQQEDTESSLDLPEPDEKVESVTQALTEAAKEEVAITTQMGKGSEVTEEAEIGRASCRERV